MQRNRPGFAFEIAVGAIVIIGIALIVLLFMFYNASTTEVESTYITPIVESKQEIKKKDLNSYLDSMENYQEKEVDSSSAEASSRKDRSNVIARGSELGENSIIKVINNIVTEALSRVKESAIIAKENAVEESELNTTQTDAL